MDLSWVPLLLAQAEKTEETISKLGEHTATVNDNFQEAITSANSFQDLLRGLGELAKESLIPLAINLVAALLIFVIGRWLARIGTRVVGKLLTRAHIDATLHKFLLNIVYAILLILAIVVAIGRLGVDTTSFAAVLGAAGVAVGFALKDSLSNFASGVMLVLFKPFGVGDFVDAGGVKGTVEEVHLFNTLMKTGDNVQHIVPNSMIMGATITNFSAKDERRIDLVVGCGYGDNLRDVKQFLIDLLENESRILSEPAPVVAVNELGESSVDFVVRPWVKSADYWATRWELNEAIKNGFDERGFSIPYPSRDVFMHNA